MRIPLRPSAFTDSLIAHEAAIWDNFRVVYAQLIYTRSASALNTGTLGAYFEHDFNDPDNRQSAGLFYADVRNHAGAVWSAIDATRTLTFNRATLNRLERKWWQVRLSEDKDDFETTQGVILIGPVVATNITSSGLVDLKVTVEFANPTSPAKISKGLAGAWCPVLCTSPEAIQSNSGAFAATLAQDTTFMLHNPDFLAPEDVFWKVTSPDKAFTPIIMRFVAGTIKADDFAAGATKLLALASGAQDLVFTRIPPEALPTITVPDGPNMFPPTTIFRYNQSGNGSLYVTGVPQPRFDVTTGPLTLAPGLLNVDFDRSKPLMVADVTRNPLQRQPLPSSVSHHTIVDFPSQLSVDFDRTKPLMVADVNSHLRQPAIVFPEVGVSNSPDKPLTVQQHEGDKWRVTVADDIVHVTQNNGDDWTVHLSNPVLNVQWDGQKVSIDGQPIKVEDDSSSSSLGLLAECVLALAKGVGDGGKALRVYVTNGPNPESKLYNFNIIAGLKYSPIQLILSQPLADYAANMMDRSDYIDIYVNPDVAPKYGPAWYANFHFSVVIAAISQQSVETYGYTSCQFVLAVVRVQDPTDPNKITQHGQIASTPGCQYSQHVSPPDSAFNFDNVFQDEMMGFTAIKVVPAASFHTH